MPSGPPKSFDPDRAIDGAREVFWRLGYAEASISVLEAELGVGRKSLYDTFGGKRELYLRALERYGDSVIRRMCEGLEREGVAPFENIERVLTRLARHHGSDESRGCLIGLAMAHGDPGGDEAGEVVRAALGRLEASFRRALEGALADGAIRADAVPADHARALVALTQGLALMGRAAVPAATLRAAVRATLGGLRA